MILELSENRKKVVAYLLLVILYLETIIPGYALGSSRFPVRSFPSEIITPTHKLRKENSYPVSPVVKKEIAGSRRNAFIGGPTQPEMQAFASVSNANMVDLFTGNFSYTIPLLDVGGYPIAIGYNSGISMDQEASPSDLLHKCLTSYLKISSSWKWSLVSKVSC